MEVGSFGKLRLRERRKGCLAILLTHIKESHAGHMVFFWVKCAAAEVVAGFFWTSENK